MTIRPYLLLGLVFAASMLPSRAALQSHLDENLKDLEKLVGKWEFHSSDPEEAENLGIEIYEADPGGRSLAVTILPRNFSKDSETKPAFFTRGIWFFDPEVKQLVYIWVDADGSSGKDFLSPQDASKKEFTGKGTGVSATGKRFTYTTHLKWIDADSYVYWETGYNGSGAEKKPDSPKYTVKRIKS